MAARLGGAQNRTKINFNLDLGHEFSKSRRYNLTVVTAYRNTLYNASDEGNTGASSLDCAFTSFQLFAKMTLNAVGIQ